MIRRRILLPDVRAFTSIGEKTMLENDWITFNTNIWGYDFTCEECGVTGSSEGEAPLSTMRAMKDKGWTFRVEGTDFIPLCPECSADAVELP